MLGSLSRTYPARARPKLSDQPIVFHMPELEELREPVAVGYIRQFFDVLGVNQNRLHFLTVPMEIDELTVFGSQFMDRIFCDTNLSRNMQAAVLAPSAPAGAPAAGHAFVSRSLLEGGTNDFVSDRNLDDIARDLGFDVIHPETMTLRDQISVFDRYLSVSGFQSSFFHLKGFCRNAGRVNILVPEEKRTFSINFLKIDIACGFDDRYHLVNAQRAETPRVKFQQTLKIDRADLVDTLVRIKQAHS
ncbi:hypothetical protein [Falsirhodobacter sp. 1013]|uniref:hypothetical protein n=1 Tax=Falsirhodobacter sp. 1013 TaxID=3417566 RepID=UPI003EBA337D